TGGAKDQRRRCRESVRADEAEETAQSVERLNHRGDQRGVAAVARKHLADREFQAADQLFGLLLFLIGHVGGLLRRSEHSRFSSLKFEVSSLKARRSTARPQTARLETCNLRLPRVCGQR